MFPLIPCGCWLCLQTFSTDSSHYIKFIFGHFYFYIRLFCTAKLIIIIIIIIIPCTELIKTGFRMFAAYAQLKRARNGGGQEPRLLVPYMVSPIQGDGSVSSLYGGV